MHIQFLKNSISQCIASVWPACIVFLWNPRFFCHRRVNETANLRWECVMSSASTGVHAAHRRAGCGTDSPKNPSRRQRRETNHSIVILTLNYNYTRLDRFVIYPLLCVELQFSSSQHPDRKWTHASYSLSLAELTKCPLFDRARNYGTERVWGWAWKAWEEGRWGVSQSGLNTVKKEEGMNWTWEVPGLDPAAVIGFWGALFCSAKRFRGTPFLLVGLCVSVWPRESCAWRLVCLSCSPSGDMMFRFLLKTGTWPPCSWGRLLWLSVGVGQKQEERVGQSNKCPMELEWTYNIPPWSVVKV